MAAELAILNPGEMQAAVEYADRLACSGLIPDVYQGKPANVLWALEFGRTLGLSTIAAINGVNVIKGKPTASAALISALVRRAGHKMRIGYDAATMTGWAEIVRCDDPDFTFRAEWDLERAVEAELCKIKDGKPFAVDSKGNTLPWKKFYPSMVKARATTEVARDACEEVLFGLHYTPEELGAVVDEDGTPIVVQQAPESAPQMASAPLREPTPARPRPAAGVQRDRPQQPAEDEWTQPVFAPTPQIDDAEIVPETHPFWETDDGKHRLTVLHALIAQKSGPKTDEERYAGFTKWCKREITSAKQMLPEEAQAMIGAFRKASDYTPPQSPPSPEEQQAATARAQAEELAATAEPDADRIESDLRDRIESAGHPDELKPILADAQAAVKAARIGTVHLTALKQAAKLRAQALEAEVRQAQRAADEAAADQAYAGHGVAA